MSDERCECGADAGDYHFDRSICPEPCGMMHYFCNECGDLAVGEKCCWAPVESPHHDPLEAA